MSVYSSTLEERDPIALDSRHLLLATVMCWLMGLEISYI
jgi:hypothetical protein